MQVGDYIQDRILPEMVKAVCAAHDIRCTLVSNDWVARLEKADTVRWVFGYKFDVNGSAAASVAQDKVATYLVLREAGLACVPHILARTGLLDMITPQDAGAALANDRPVVIKPLTGTGGRGAERCDDIQTALAKIAANTEPAWALSPYLDLTSERRVIVLDGQVLLAYEKRNPIIQNGLKLYNLGKGAVADDIELDDATRAMALAACKALGLRLGAVDIVTTSGGEQLVIEVNDGMMMESYARQSPQNARKAESIYEAIITSMMV